ncbi:MAG: hypothetical protein IJ604_06215 [Prevotella sp.]|nr:hypothetical protein [Prevotella sp.]MBR1462959.1 hypothetical protein [Prevotella sp.]
MKAKICSVQVSRCMVPPMPAHAESMRFDGANLTKRIGKSLYFLLKQMHSFSKPMVSPRKTYAFGLQNLWFQTSKPMVLRPETYAFEG